MTILASGSTGNCTLLESSRTRILIDAGLSKRETLKRMTALGVVPDSLDAILISHEHSDHVNGIASLMSQWRKAAVYLTDACRAEIERAWAERAAADARAAARKAASEAANGSRNGAEEFALEPGAPPRRLDRAEPIQAGQRLTIGDIEVTAFRIPHDAVDPLGFSFRCNGCKVGIVTDLGYLPDLVKVHLRDSDLLMLESNHDTEMLKVGPYPWHIKQRVLSRTGHLSNEAVSEFLADAEGFDARPRHLVLAHLSENNNNPDVARICAEEALRRRSVSFTGALHVAAQRVPLGPYLL